MSKSLAIFNILVDCLDLRFLPLADQYINLFLDNANTGYAEVSRVPLIPSSASIPNFAPQIRSQIASNIYAIITIQWRPVYPSVSQFVSACNAESDPFHIRYVRRPSVSKAVLTEVTARLVILSESLKS